MESNLLQRMLSSPSLHRTLILFVGCKRHHYDAGTNAQLQQVFSQLAHHNKSTHSNSQYSSSHLPIGKLIISNHNNLVSFDKSQKGTLQLECFGYFRWKFQFESFFISVFNCDKFNISVQLGNKCSLVPYIGWFITTNLVGVCAWSRTIV